MPCRGCCLKSEQGAVLFRRGTGNGTSKGQTILQDIPLIGCPYSTNPLRHLLRKCHLPRRGRLIPHPHLAGTQTALPSVPTPTRVSLVVVPLLTNDIVPSPPFASQMPPPPKGEANPAYPLAGTQMALPSVPVPTRGSLVVVLASSKRHRALSAICFANATSPEGGG